MRVTRTVSTPMDERADAVSKLMKRSLGNLCLLIILFAALAAGDARAETLNCTAITSLPYTISTPGSYCLTSHLSTDVTSGNAITINASNVVLDLNGFALNFAPSANSDSRLTDAFGIYALNRSNITIRNGTVGGFKGAIFLNGDQSAWRGNLIEGIKAERNRFGGIGVTGGGNTIRNNLVLRTGGLTVSPIPGGVHGISILGPGNRALNNDVIEVNNKLDPMSDDPVNDVPSGIYVVGDDCVIEANRISRGNGRGILVFGGENIAVVNNRVTGTQSGIIMAVQVAVFRDNMIVGGLGYTGGTDAGGNYPPIP